MLNLITKIQSWIIAQHKCPRLATRPTYDFVIGTDARPRTGIHFNYWFRRSTCFPPEGAHSHLASWYLALPPPETDMLCDQQNLSERCLWSTLTSSTSITCFDPSIPIHPAVWVGPCASSTLVSMHSLNIMAVVSDSETMFVHTHPPSPSSLVCHPSLFLHPILFPYSLSFLHPILFPYPPVFSSHPTPNLSIAPGTIKIRREGSCEIPAMLLCISVPVKCHDNNRIGISALQIRSMVDYTGKRRRSG